MSGLCLCAGAAACGSSAEVTAVTANSAITEFDDLADFDAATFTHPAIIDNEWFPLVPGSEFVHEGVTLEDDVEVPHRYILTVTDLTKEVLGVQTVVVWDQDFTDGEPNEAEIGLFAQDSQGWGPAVEWTDRARASSIEDERCTPSSVRMHS